MIRKHLHRLFNNVADKERFFSRRNVVGGAAATAMLYGVTGFCVYKTVEPQLDKEFNEFASWQTVQDGGRWAIAASAAGYAGDATLVYTLAGGAYRRFRRQRA